MGRFVGGVFGNTLGSDTAVSDTTGVFSMRDQYYIIREGGWVPGPGAAEETAQPNAAAIYNSGQRTNGVYWLKHGSNAAYQTWCWLDSTSGGGYFLVAKIADNNPSAWYYNGGNWTTSSAISPSNCQNLNNNDSVAPGYYQYDLQSGFRMCLHADNPSVPSNYLIENKNGFTAKEFFSDTNGGSQNGRADFKSWVAGAASGFDDGFNSNLDSCQQNCNQFRFYQDTGHGKARWGGFGNNENDCGSVDSSLGYGGSSYAGDCASGAKASHCGAFSRFAKGWIFVK